MLSNITQPIIKYQFSMQDKKNRKTVSYTRKFLFPILALSITSTVQAAESCETIGRLASVEGIVEVQRADTSKWLNTKTDDTFMSGRYSSSRS